MEGDPRETSKMSAAKGAVRSKRRAGGRRRADAAQSVVSNAPSKHASFQ